MDEDGEKRIEEAGRRPSAFELNEASNWLLRLRGAPDDAALRLAFQAWLRRSPQHEQAYRRVERAWTLLGRLPPVFEPVWRDADDVEVLRRPVQDPRSRARRRIAISFLGVAAASIVVAWAVLPGLLVAFGADYATGTAESRHLSLPDGSQVVLGADSAIDIDLRSADRKVVLLEGEAYFDVAPDPTRPFHVVVGALRITVVGTRFDAALTSSETRIDLASGTIEISGGRSRREPTTMAAGDRLVLDRATEAVTRSIVDVGDVGAWRRGQLFVENATIGSVVETIQRHHDAFVAIPDPGLSRLRVTGLYDLRDPDRALSALVEPHGGHVRSLSPYLRVLSRF